MKLKSQLKYKVYPFKALNLQDMAEHISSGGFGLKLITTLMVMERFMEELGKAAIAGNEFRHEALSMQHVMKGPFTKEKQNFIPGRNSVGLSFTAGPKVERAFAAEYAVQRAIPWQASQKVQKIK